MKLLKIVFSLFILNFLVILFGIFLTEWLMGKLFFPPIIMFFLLGLFLIILTLKQKIKGKLKIFLLLSGISAVVFLVSIILHNLFYALAILSEDILILKYLFEVLHIAFFFIGIPICPILFLIGIIGSLILFLRGKKF